MSSLLLPVVLETCSGGLRDRRRSSVHSVVAVPRLFAASLLEGSAVCVEKDPVEPKAAIAHSSQVFIPPTLPTLPHIQLTNNEKLCPRYLPEIRVDEILTPSSSLPSTTFSSRKSSITSLPATLHLDAPKTERLRWRLASAFFAYFLCGWGDGVTGTVLPHFMQQYNISFMMSSLLYAGSTLGFMLGTLLVETIINALGRFNLAQHSWSWIPEIIILSQARQERNAGFSPSQARLLALLVSSVLHAAFFVVMGIAKGGFWVLFTAYALAAFARAILTATLNEFFASASPPSIGYAYGLWSFGGTVSPLVCQSLLATGVPWGHFYLGSLVLSACNTSFLVLTYRPTVTEASRDRKAAHLLSSQQRRIDELSSVDDTADKNATCESPIEAAAPKGSQNLMSTLRQPFQWAVCLFGLLYCGCETTTQSLVSNLLALHPSLIRMTVDGVLSPGSQTRQSKHCRLRDLRLLGWHNFLSDGMGALFRPTRSSKPQIRNIRLCTALLMQVLIWVVDSNVENAFSTGMIGLFFGPVFPACLALANDVLPSEGRMISMALISATSSIGASFFPFLAGILSSASSIRVVPYITVPLAASIICLWITFPSKIVPSKH